MLLYSPAINPILKQLYLYGSNEYDMMKTTKTFYIILHNTDAYCQLIVFIVFQLVPRSMPVDG